MPYDNLCKALVERNPLPFVHWLVGQTPEPVQILKTELSVEPIRADFVSFLQVGAQVLHLEFQTAPDPEMPLRMLDYYVRLRRQYRCEVLQIVLFLRQTQSTWAHLDRLATDTTLHRYRVVRIWEEPAKALLRDPGLWPLAILAGAKEPEALLRQVAEEIQRWPNPQERANLAAYTYLLGGLRFEKELLQQLLREEVMRESVTYQALVEESERRGIQQGLTQGIQQGLTQGIQQGEAELTLRLLRRKLGSLPEELETQIRSLPVEHLEELSEALLEFETLADLTTWLNSFNP
ncbi:DUF4351 domain-containing protein [Thermostichus vulcanus]|uniref:Rpn family recombination-promoting nuclease/putative transposase n=1 Tax=Thermostichus vulcanus str. 'Rupite' TaxID=2813851 RepID=A0ABT0CFQ0_THEVL|nr:DUF4351 domain-containing protein [Thermostichus vulcanus]MCJ2544612.1 Rpn family recombination-promoting nuclease/putative transposase [Thermostichus vulcanus str. 'Rupite']